MRTINVLAHATAANAAQALTFARKRGWTDASIRKHGSKAVRALLGGKPARGKQVRQPVTAYASPAQQVAKDTLADLLARMLGQGPAAPKPTRSTAKALTGGQAVAVTLTRNGVQQVAQVELGAPRAKEHGKGNTHDAMWHFAGGHELHTLSEQGVTRLLGGERVHVWLGGHSYVATLAQ